jgi:serine/threonine-protein kinase
MLRILCDALTGLHYAHELADYDGTPLKVVHRDVSPHNIFVTYDGIAKMVDFGIAKAAVRSAYTSTGVVKGKISYMAPEQALSAPIDRRADVFSMGVILWELAAGERLWGTLSEVQILQKMAFGEVPRLASRVPDAPPQLDGICARALAMVPGERYATAAELRDEVERYLKQSNAAANNADVSKLVAGMFKDRRDEVKSVIQEQLRDMKEDGTLPPRNVAVPDIAVSTESNIAVPPNPGFPKEVSEARPAAIEATPSLSGTMSTSAIQRALPKRRIWPTVLVGIFAGLGIGGLLAWRGGIYERLRGDPQAVSTASTASVGTEPPASTATAGSLIEVRIGTQAPRATIYLDDVALDKNPFVAKFPADGTAHRLRVEAPGHETHNQLLVFDGDVALDVQLEAEGTTVKPGGSAPTASATAATSAPVKTAPVGGRPRGPKVDTKDPFAPTGKGH